MSKSRRKPILVDRRVQSKAVKRYQSGESLASLAMEYGCSSSYLSRLFTRLGAVVRSVTKQRLFACSVPDDEAKQMVVDRYNSGESIASIATDLKGDTHFIGHIIRDAGIILRSGPYKHGASRTTEYKIWKGLTRRRSVSVCDGWRSFVAFHEDVGDRPEAKLNFGRTDKSRPFTCGWCRQCKSNDSTRNGEWMTREIACRGGSRAVWITWNGKRQTLAEWSREIGIHQMTITRRIEAGWPIERALTAPADQLANLPIVKGLDSSQTINLIGKRFGKLLVVDFAGFKRRHILQWLCQCDCGRQVTVVGGSLRDGHTKSCGCYRLRMDDKGRVPSKAHPLYLTWRNMLLRCRKHLDYAGRGIQVCSRWKRSFWDFIENMGPRPVGCSIDRIDNNGHYSCGHCEDCKNHCWTANCKWADNVEQARNKRTSRFITAFGMTMTLAEWSQISGLDRRRIDSRIRRGWSSEQAVSTPLIKSNHH